MSTRSLSARLARLERGAAPPPPRKGGGGIFTNGRFWDMVCGAARNVTEAEQAEWDAIWRGVSERNRDEGDPIERCLEEERAALASDSPGA